MIARASKTPSPLTKPPWPLEHVPEALGTRTISQTEPTTAKEPLVTNPMVRGDLCVSADPEAPSPDGYGSLADMLLLEEISDPLDFAPDATPLETNRYGPLDEMNLPENAGLDHQRDYVVDRIVSAKLNDERDVHSKDQRCGYEPKDDTCLPRSAISNHFLARYWSKTGHKVRDLQNGGIPGHKFVLTRASSASIQ